jgi:hypothetical protein
MRMKLNLSERSLAELFALNYWMSIRCHTREEMDDDEWSEAMREIEDEIKLRIFTNTKDP